MSGIVAVFNRDLDPSMVSSIEQMLAAADHRGVDGQNTWTSGCVALAHQHFWITPQEQGERQPIVLHEGRYAITYDGRLDNRRQIRELLELTVPEESLSDADLVLRAYVQWGVACVDHLLGDFAFVIWDSDEHHMFVARDPLGTRQVCYSCDDDRVVVASTVAQVLAHPDVGTGLNEGTIAEYLVGYEYNQRESHYQDVSFCPPGHCLLITPTRFREWRYWRPDIGGQRKYADDEEYVEEFYSLLQQAVHDRLRFSGKVGISLSGGMDSTSVTALVHQELARDRRLPPQGLKTYSYVFDDYPECDESQYIRTLVQRYGLDSTLIESSQMPVLSGQEIPMFSPDCIFSLGGSYILWSLLQCMQRDGCKMQLSGGYGDLLYQRQTQWAADLLRNGRVHQLWSGMRRNQAERKDWSQIGRSLIRPYVPQTWLSAYRSENRKQMRLNSGIDDKFANKTGLDSRVSVQAVPQPSRRPGVMEQYLLSHGGTYVRFKPVVNDWAARLGIEIWEPFRDRRLVEYALSLPAYILGAPGATKWILRRAMSQHLPQAIVAERPGAIMNPWLEGRFWRSEWRLVRDTLSDGPQVLEHGYVRHDWLEERLSIQERCPGEDNSLWRVLILEIWLAKFSQL